MKGSTVLRKAFRVPSSQLEACQEEKGGIQGGRTNSIRKGENKMKLNRVANKKAIPRASGRRWPCREKDQGGAFTVRVKARFEIGEPQKVTLATDQVGKVLPFRRNYWYW